MLPRRTIDEIVTLRVIEPDARDVFVEGQGDLHIVCWFLGECASKRVTVYTIDAVDVPNSLVVALGLPTHSNRSRVIALAHELENKGICLPSVLCVADRDYDDYLGGQVVSSLLAYSDYTSMDLYCYEPGTISKFLGMTLGIHDFDAGKLMEDMSRILRKMFALRLANERLGWGMTLLKPQKYIQCDSKSVVFDESRYVLNSLLSNGKITERDLYEAVVADAEAQLDTDDRQSIRGKDLMEVFFYISKKLLYRTAYGNIHTFRRALISCLERAALERYPLFATLMKL